MQKRYHIHVNALLGQVVPASFTRRWRCVFGVVALLLVLLCPALSHAQAHVNDTTRTRNIKEVVVKANRGARAVGMIKQTAEQLKVEMPADMTDLVRYMPSVGVSISGSRGGMRGFAMRGVEANRVAISVDGILQPDIQDNVVFSSYGLSNASRIDFDPYLASSVEIQRGANSFVSGNGALGGTVNYNTKNARDLIVQGKQWGAFAHVGYNGKDNLRTYIGGGAALWKHWEALLLATRRDGNELRNFAYGQRTRNITSTQADPISFAQHAWLAKLAYVPNEHHRLDWAFYAMNRKADAEIWTLEPIDAFTAEGKPYYYSHDQSLTRQASMGYRFTSDVAFVKKLAARLHYQVSYLDATTWTDYYRPNFDQHNGNMTLLHEGKRDKYRAQEIGDALVRLSLDTRKLSFGALGQHNLNFTTTVSLRNYSSRNVDVENPVAANTIDGYTVRRGKVYALGENMGTTAQAYAFLNPIRRFNLAVSLLDDAALSPVLNLKLGLRYDLFHTTDDADNQARNTGYIAYLLQNVQGANMDFSPINNVQGGISALAVLAFTPKAWFNVAYKFSTGYRVPNIEEQYFQYYSTWPSFLVMSNRDLKPEKSINHELEITGKTNALAYMFSAYYNHYADFIELRQGVLTVSEPLMSQEKRLAYVTNVNRDHAHLVGFDAALQLYPDAWWPALRGVSLSSAWSYAQGESSSGMSMLSVQPLAGNVGLAYTGANSRWEVNAKMNFHFAKPVSQTTFWDRDAAGRDLIRRFPAAFLQNAYTFDIYAYYKIGAHITLRAGVYNLFDTQYHRWDDLRQLTNPALLGNINLFFKDGRKSLARFTQPRRYLSAAVEINI